MRLACPRFQGAMSQPQKNHQKDTAHCEWVFDNVFQVVDFLTYQNSSYCGH
jgi:hypothetical protein